MGHTVEWVKQAVEDMYDLQYLSQVTVLAYRGQLDGAYRSSSVKPG